MILVSLLFLVCVVSVASRLDFVARVELKISRILVVLLGFACLLFL